LDLDRAGRTPPTLTLLLISHASRMQGQRTGVSALHEICGKGVKLDCPGKYS
jgi:hypothetical protein